MLVKENISFQRGVDPKVSLGIGARTLIEKWLKIMIISEYIINDDMSINANQNVRLPIEKIGIINMLPEFIKFNIVDGDFCLAHNELTSLQGFPKIVTGYCTCGKNKLTSLIGSPEKCGSFSCTGNLLTSLVGCPKEVAETFWCDENPGEFKLWDVRMYCNVHGDIRI